MEDALPDGVTTLFEHLKPQGYRTAIFSGNRVVSSLFNYGQGVDVFVDDRQRRPPERTLLYRTIVSLGFPHALLRRLDELGDPRRMNDRAVQDLWVVRHFQHWLATLDEKPFCAYVHLFGAHAPYLPLPPQDRAFGHLPGDPRSEKPPARFGDAASPGEPLPESVRREMIDRYDSLVLFADSQIREVVESLRRDGLLDNTLVVVTADHGEAFWNHRMWSHGGSLYGELVRVPLVVWAGGALRRRMDFSTGPTDAPVSTIDVMPTLLGLAKVPCPTCQGESLLVLARKGEGARPIHMEQSPERGVHLYAVVQGDRKLIRTRDEGAGRDRWEAYDLKQDPNETRDRLRDDPGPYAGLRREFEVFRRGDLSRRAHAAASIDLRRYPATLEKLRALGYVD